MSIFMAAAECCFLSLLRADHGCLAVPNTCGQSQELAFDRSGILHFISSLYDCSVDASSCKPHLRLIAISRSWTIG